MIRSKPNGVAGTSETGKHSHGFVDTEGHPQTCVNHKKGNKLKKIGVIGAGLVGSIFKELDEFQVVHRNEWKDVIWDWKGVVNCAAITGLDKCEETDFAQVLRANVRMPIDIADYAANLQIPFIQFSTSAVYRLPTKFKLVEEDDPLYPYNTYSGSKILMERVLPKSCFIFRIPVVSTGSGADNDYAQKVKRWTYVEDVHKSIVYKDTLIEAVRSALGAHYKAGVYNIGSEVIHLPTYVKEQFGWEGEIVPANSLGRSPAIALDTSKAEVHGLI